MSADVSKMYTDADVQTARRIHLSSMATSSGAMREALDAVVPGIVSRAVNRAKAEALREMAEQTENETVCCDEYEAFKAGVARPEYAHHICYWGAAHAEALRDRADEIERGES